MTKNSKIETDLSFDAERFNTAMRMYLQPDTSYSKQLQGWAWPKWETRDGKKEFAVVALIDDAGDICPPTAINVFPLSLTANAYVQNAQAMGKVCTFITPGMLVEQGIRTAADFGNALKSFRENKRNDETRKLFDVGHYTLT